MTYAELKRHADTGMMRLELMERYGETDDNIPARLRGIRKVIRSRSFGLELRNADGNTSDLRIEAASLIDYDGATLTVYLPGERELTEDEYKAWQYIHKADYWTAKARQNSSKYPWVGVSSDTIKGKRLSYKDGKPVVVDNAIKGKAILRYRVTFEG